MNILHRSLWRHKQRKESGNASHLFVRVESSLLQLGVATGRVLRHSRRLHHSPAVGLHAARGPRGHAARAGAASRRRGRVAGVAVARFSLLAPLGQQVGGQVFTLVQLSSCRSTGLLSRRRCALRASFTRFWGKRLVGA